MIKRNLKVILAGLLMLCVLGLTAHARTVKVGVVLTYSGGFASFGQQIQRAMDLYMDMEGNRKLGSHKINFIKRDSKRPGGDIAKNAVRELIVKDKVDILTGFIFSPNIIASAPLVNQGKVPTLVMNAGTAWIPNLTPYIARVSFTMWHSAYPMGEYAFKTLKCKTAAVGYTNYPPGKDSLNGFKTSFEASGGKIVEAVPMGGPGKVPDFTPFMQRVKDRRPDCFYVFVPGGIHAASVFKTFADLGMRKAGIKLIGPADLTQDTKLQGLGPDAVGVVVMGHYQADLKNPENRAFVKAWKKKYGANTTPDFLASQGYDGMAAIVHAIVKQNGRITAKGTMAAWKKWKFNGPRGPVSIDPETRDIIQDIKAFQVVKKGSGLGMKTLAVFPQIKDPCKANKIGRCGK